jgi:hypothetical protein
VSRDAHVGAEILLYSSLDPIKCVVFVVVKATNKGRSDLFFFLLFDSEGRSRSVIRVGKFRV